MKIPQTPPKFNAILTGAMGNKKKLSLMIAQRATDARGRYLHWDDLRFKSPLEGLSIEETWAGMKIARQQQLRPTPFTSKDGRHFEYVETDELRWLLHWIDGKATGNFVMPIPLDNQAIGKTFHVSSLIEEAFSSSRLEGAATTRAVAKAMLREGRQPRNKSERMIWNNYQAMEFIGRHRSDPLTPEMIFELHKIVTDLTLDDPSMAGVFRRPSDTVVVEDAEGNVLHDPPRASELEQRLRLVCNFANSPPFGPESTSFLHPVIRAVVLHFMIGYDHPFVDGNGRTARALFYWHMIRSGYSLAQYISISSIMTKAPIQYGRAYLETETDDCDLTYFIIHQLKVIKKSVEELIKYLEQKARELVELESSLMLPGHKRDFNYRQLDILKRGVERPGMMISIKDHSRANRVTYQTARSDLLSLSDAGLLMKKIMGKQFVFVAPPDLRSRVAAYQKGLKHSTGKTPRKLSSRAARVP
jgi:Fic family protein